MTIKSHIFIQWLIYSKEKKRITSLCYNMDTSHKHNAERKNQDAKETGYIYLIYMNM